VEFVLYASLDNVSFSTISLPRIYKTIKLDSIWNLSGQPFKMGNPNNRDPRGKVKEQADRSAQIRQRERETAEQKEAAEVFNRARNEALVRIEQGKKAYKDLAKTDAMPAQYVQKYGAAPPINNPASTQNLASRPPPKKDQGPKAGPGPTLGTRPTAWTRPMVGTEIKAEPKSESSVILAVESPLHGETNWDIFGINSTSKSINSRDNDEMQVGSSQSQRPKRCLFDQLKPFGEEDFSLAMNKEWFVQWIVECDEVDIGLEDFGEIELSRVDCPQNMNEKDYKWQQAQELANSWSTATYWFLIREMMSKHPKYEVQKLPDMPIMGKGARETPLIPATPPVPASPKVPFDSKPRNQNCKPAAGQKSTLPEMRGRLPAKETASGSSQRFAQKEKKSFGENSSMIPSNTRQPLHRGRSRSPLRRNSLQRPRSRSHAPNAAFDYRSRGPQGYVSRYDTYREASSSLQHHEAGYDFHLRMMEMHDTAVRKFDNEIGRAATAREREVKNSPHWDELDDRISMLSRRREDRVQDRDYHAAQVAERRSLVSRRSDW
jgi:hypothetical protein